MSALNNRSRNASLVMSEMSVLFPDLVTPEPSAVAFNANAFNASVSVLVDGGDSGQMPAIRQAMSRPEDKHLRKLAVALFSMLDERYTGVLTRRQLRLFAILCGTSEDTWDEEYSKLCADRGWPTSAGISQERFIALLDMHHDHHPYMSLRGLVDNWFVKPETKAQGDDEAAVPSDSSGSIIA